MPYNDENPIYTWDLTDYEPEVLGDFFLGDFWRTINDLPVGSVIATGFFDDGLVYFEKDNEGWKIVQVNNPNVEDVFPVGTRVTESAEIDAGGDIEIAYVIREGA